MDTKLDGLNRDDYIKELLRICRKDVSMLTDYTTNASGLAT